MASLAKKRALGTGEESEEDHEESSDEGDSGDDDSEDSDEEINEQADVPEDSDDDDDDIDEVFGFISLLNLTERKLFLFCTAMKKCGKILNDTTKPVGLLLSERFINVPPQIALPLHKQLQEEIAEAQRTNKPTGKCHFYIMISKTFKEAGKNNSTLRGGAPKKEELMFTNAEEEFFHESPYCCSIQIPPLSSQFQEVVKLKPLRLQQSVSNVSLLSRFGSLSRAVCVFGSMVSLAKKRALGTGEEPEEDHEESSDEGIEGVGDSGDDNSEDSDEEINEQADVPEDSDNDDDDIDEVFGFISLLNLTERKGSECVEQIKELVLEHCEKCCPKNIAEQLDEVLSDTTKPVGLLLSERFINVPPQIALPLHKQLQEEIAEAQRTNKPTGKCHFYIMISKTFKEAGKNNSTLRGGAPKKEELMFTNAEEEFFHEHAVLKFNYSVQEESDSCLAGRWSFDDVPMKSFRTVMLIPAKSISPIMEKLREYLSI
ncbi:UNVERIFIED_CONTAM: hypothetical protein FKN15_037547 [Acipenser sinensis]